VGTAPTELLAEVGGLSLVDINEPAECCGFGGTFSVKNPDVSTAMMADKIEAVRTSGAAVITSVDNSCLMHLAGGMRRMGFLCEDGEIPVPGSRLQVMHLAEILASRIEENG
jgi:L-lactate dehydrogenase complex protein LldE